MTARHLALALALFLLGLGQGAKAQNLVPDPSFEADAPSWFVEDGSPHYVAEKRALAPREGGQTVLAISAWAPQGAQVSSLPLAVRAGAVSATACIRLFGAQPVDAELFLVDDKGEHVATFFKTRIAPGVTWRRLNATSSLAASADVRLVLAVTGASRGARLELDDVGLFESRQTSPVSDTSHFEWFDGESLAGQSPAWRATDHFPSWYHEFPIGGRMLNGAGPVAPQDNKPALRRIHVRAAGTYVLWTRFLRTNAPNHAAFSVEIVQDGKRAGALDVADDSVATFGGAELEWVFAPLRVRLTAGTAEIVVRRPQAEVSWIARKIDMFVLTNLAYFTPRATDFRTHGFVRFVNEGAEGFCLFADLRRHQGPTWYVHRMWTGRGPVRAYHCPADQRIGPSESSPWVRISDDLSPALGRNNLSLLATTGSHTTGLYRGRLRGRLEFATGTRRDVIKTIEVDQNAPRMLLTVGASFDSESIRTSSDYIEQEERRAAEVQPNLGEPARHIDLSVILSGVQAELDPSSLVERELAVVHRLGFNSLNTPITTPAATAEFNREHNLRHAGTWAPLLNLNDTRAPSDRRKVMADAWRKFASDFGSSLAALDHVKLLDEPQGAPLTALLSRAEDFRAWLKGLGLNPAAFRRKRWSDVSPRAEVDRAAYPREFYWSSMYRLHALANDIRVAVDAKRDAGIPSSVRSYVNYTPTSSGGSFTAHGTDPFFLQREGGLELSWTEDWLGWGVSVQHVSDHVGVLRAASKRDRQPLGMYIVGVDGPPELQRIRFYEALAAGVTHFCSYNYGPSYASVDSWGTRMEVYGPISNALHELAAVDEALHRTTRRGSDVAVLYNRTAAIWSLPNTSQEQDARYAFWALSHAGYQPDFLPEEDAEAGDLKRYKSLYVSGTHLRRSTALAIRRWVAAGGVLFTSAGAATRDEVDGPLHVLDDVVGIRDSTVETLADAGRPKYELRALKPLSAVSTTPESKLPELHFNVLALCESFTPTSKARVVLRDGTGRPAGVLVRYGRGTALRVAALPGLAYAHEAVSLPSFDPESYRPSSYRPELRDLISYAARIAGAQRTISDQPSVESVRFDGPDETVLVLVNHGPPSAEMTLRLPDARFTKARTATGTTCSIASAPAGAVELRLSLDGADAIVLSR